LHREVRHWSERGGGISNGFYTYNTYNSVSSKIVQHVGVEVTIGEVYYMSKSRSPNQSCHIPIVNEAAGSKSYHTAKTPRASLVKSVQVYPVPDVPCCIDYSSESNGNVLMKWLADIRPLSSSHTVKKGYPGTPSTRSRNMISYPGPNGKPHLTCIGSATSTDFET
jgi:hypothetical protein